MLDNFLSFWPVGTSGGQMPIVASTESLLPFGDTDPQPGVSSMERQRIMATYCSITVISPLGKWNVWVSERHRSTSAINAVEFIIGILSVMSRASGRNPARLITEERQVSVDVRYLQTSTNYIFNFNFL
jgi:hypothetical protein